VQFSHDGTRKKGWLLQHEQNGRCCLLFLALLLQKHAPGLQNGRRMMIFCAHSITSDFVHDSCLFAHFGIMMIPIPSPVPGIAHGQSIHPNHVLPLGDNMLHSL